MHAFRYAPLLLLAAALLAACAASGAGSPGSSISPTTSSLFGAPPSQLEATPARADEGPALVIDTDAAGTPIDRRLFGTNLPAWLGPEKLADPELQSRIAELGPTLLRLPGGSWSNSYDWLACQTGDAERCYWPWAAKPGDFLNLLKRTGQEAMWTVSINGTAQEAAALVAFFNGDVDDERPIGVDRRGRDWQTVGTWARLRRDAGHPEPYPIRLWEIGNEVYGGKADAAPGCTPWGWEDVWTCDGAEYVNGTAQHDGYLAFREAMRAVDPDILVGAVGVEDPAAWSAWGEKVIEAAGAALDFYVVHVYAFGDTPPDAVAALALPQQIWPQISSQVRAAFAQHSDGRVPPIAVTEYNLVAFQDLDTSQLMRRAVNALFVADSIGQMATHGVTIANQWNFANGLAENGTDYGLVHSDDSQPYPQYYAFLLWQRFGDALLPLESPFDPETTLSLYAGRANNGTIALLAINKTADPIEVNFRLEGVPERWLASADVVAADGLDAERVQFNGSYNGPAARSIALGELTGTSSYTFEPFSITLIRFVAQP